MPSVEINTDGWSCYSEDVLERRIINCIKPVRISVVLIKTAYDTSIILNLENWRSEIFADALFVSWPTVADLLILSNPSPTCPIGGVPTSRNHTPTIRIPLGLPQQRCSEVPKRKRPEYHMIKPRGSSVLGPFLGHSWTLACSSSSSSIINYTSRLNEMVQEVEIAIWRAMNFVKTD